MIFENTGKKSWNELDDNTKGLLMLAYYEGKTIQEWWDNENEWEDWHDFDYNSDYCYPPKWQHGIWRIKPEHGKEVHWCNDYEEEPFYWYDSREDADKEANEYRIAVIRREIVDGVVSYYKEDV